eukprot:TRINITY_DN1705_c0_g2_i1.p1 TRINITY_DN1705_c0_g2~~TRINITY_DN1705_c0_g2_i1.p1  ORF type:complete len:109 (-),score=35.64 TRINITY_DN1705_c0_g2_i1:2-328(-)
MLGISNSVRVNNNNNNNQNQNQNQNNSQQIVLDPQLHSKCFVLLGRLQYDLINENRIIKTESDFQNVLHAFQLAIDLSPKWHKVWHHWALANLQFAQFITQQQIQLQQ